MSLHESYVLVAVKQSFSYRESRADVGDKIFVKVNDLKELIELGYVGFIDDVE